MTDYIVSSPDLSLLADTIRHKGGTESPLEFPDGFISAVKNIGGGSYTPVLQNKSVSPSESSQSVTYDSGYDGLDTVTVGAVSSDYVGSGITRQAGSTITPTTSSQTAVPVGTYTTGNVVVGAIPSQYVVPTGSKSIVSNGTGIDVAEYATVNVAVPSDAQPAQSKSATPTESSQTILPDSGYVLSSVTVGAIDTEYVGSGVSRRSGSSLTVSGATVSVPEGYYSESTSKSVASGTEGIPTATKSIVSGHEVTVTPSVTNSAGYISGGTKTGTAVTVAASELVSGTYTVTGDGTANVTNYASISVADGSATASATKGAVSNHSVSVTPSVTCTAGWVSAGTSSGDAVTVSASELVSGTKSITSNGTGIDVTEYASVNVAVSGGGGAYQAKTNIDPTTSSQTIMPDNGYDALSSVQINAMPSGNVGVSASKGTVSNHAVEVTPMADVSAGYCASATKYGTAVTVTAAELASGNKPIATNGTNIDVVGYSTVSVAVPTGTDMPTFTVIWYDDWTSIKSVTCDKTYQQCVDSYDSGEVLGAIVEANDESGTTPYTQTCNCTGVFGSYIRYTTTSTEPEYDIRYNSNGTIQAVMPSAFVKTPGTPTATKGTVSNHSVSVTPSVTNPTGYINGGTVSGTAVSVSASELVNGTYAVNSSGTKDVTNYASASVPAGTAGTPSASKGTVSNHSVSVTPSVTNTSGWITGSTKTGTAVTVSASELVSGSETKSANGTYDVTNLASLVVQIPFVTYYTSSSAPTSSQGSNGDIWLKTS